MLQHVATSMKYMWEKKFHIDGNLLWDLLLML